HRPADAALGEGLELDAAVLVEAVGGVNQSEDAVLDEIADVDRVRHGRCHAAGQRLDKREPGDNAAILAGGLLRSHACTSSQPWYQRPSLCSEPHHLEAVQG